MKPFIALLFLCSFALAAWSQQDLPFIKATSKKIKVLDDDFLQDGELVPELHPDVYFFHPANRPKKIAYYTDTDSIVFWAKGGDTYHFAIVLNNKDTCYQQVTSQNPAGVTYHSAKSGLSSDTIPFLLGSNNAIHLKGKINGSETLDLIFDTGASIGVLSDQGKNKQVRLQSDNKNVFDISGISLGHSPISYIDYHGRLRADGVVGYNAFEGKVVEINYDESILVIHHRLPATNGYAMAEMKWRGSAMFIEGTVNSAKQKHKGLFLFDTGSKWALSLTHAFTNDNKLYQQLDAIGTRRAKGADGKTIKSSTVRLPLFSLAGLLLPGVPADLELAEESEGSLSFNIVGNDVLKRFNVMLDYQNGLIYLKPNSLQNTPYLKSFDEKTILFIAVALAVFALTGFLFYRRAKQRNGANNNNRILNAKKTND